MPAVVCTRVLHTCLQEKQVLKQVALPRDVYTGSSTQLFDFLARTLADFIREQEEVSPYRALMNTNTHAQLLCVSLN